MTGFTNNELVLCIPRLKRYARKLGVGDDLVQHTLLHALEKQHLYQPVKPLLNWLIKIMHNLNATNRVKQKRESRFKQLTIWDSYQDEQATLALQIYDLKRAFSALSPDRQLLLTSIFANENKYCDAAAACNIPIGTVRSRLWRTKEMLRTAMES